MENVVQVKRLSKRFKDKKAVDEVSFSIRKGEITAILGPNGAGKTTTLSMMLGLLKPSNGTVEIFGNKPNTKEVREKIGVMLQEVSVMDSLKVKELIELVRSYYKNSLPFQTLVDISGIDANMLPMRTEKLSGGQKRKVNFALSLAGNPDLLFFDEPTVGLDVTARRKFWDTVKDFTRQGKTIIFTTHYLQEADDYADRILLFNEGKLIAEGTPNEIKDQISNQYVSFIPLSEVPIAYFESLDVVKNVVSKDGRIFIYTSNTDLVVKTIFQENISLKDLTIEKGRLEEAFEHLTVQEAV